MQGHRAHALGGNLLLVLDLGAEQAAPAIDGSGEIRYRDAHMVQVTGGHAAHRATMALSVDPYRGVVDMGFLDKVKEKASEAIEQGKDVAAGQQLKLQLKKLEGEEEEALSAFGNAAFTLYEAGTLSMSSDLAAAAERIRTARAAIEAKKAEASAAGDDDTAAAETSEPVTSDAAS